MGTSVKKQLQWGILGTGLAAKLMTRDLVQQGHQVAAVGSRGQDSADSFAGLFGIPRAHGSYEALVADNSVDIIHVATPHNLHAENATMALLHGKHVLVEKAFTVNRAEAATLAQLARSLNLVVMEAMWTRFLPHMDFVRAAVRRGDIGDITHIQATHAQDLPADDDHRLNRLDLAGGALLDLGVYPISFAHDLLGKPQDIAARATFKKTGVDGTVSTHFTYASGATSETFSSSHQAAINDAIITGTTGQIAIAAVFYEPAAVVVTDNGGVVLSRYERSLAGRGMQYQALEMERLVTAGERDSPLMPLDQSVEIMGVMDAIRSEIGLRYPDE
ncbi:putative dehydrogenase [Salinibacterium sp. CAN_S4]|uniref:Gfo/Idh/MocA family protein n=1 Tax=Salinibacterium sp. CAN_S4 TaxID=2787727 RepID=UPI0018EF4A04